MILKLGNQTSPLDPGVRQRHLLRTRLSGASQAALVVEFPCSAAGTRAVGLTPGSGRSPGGVKGSPLRDSCLESPWTDEPGGLQSMGSEEMGMSEHPHPHPRSFNTLEKCWLVWSAGGREERGCCAVSGHGDPRLETLERLLKAHSARRKRSVVSSMRSYTSRQETPRNELSRRGLPRQDLMP